MSKVNKAFDYDSEKSIQNVTRDIDVRPKDDSDSNSDSGLNYDKILVLKDGEVKLNLRFTLQFNIFIFLKTSFLWKFHDVFKL